MIDVLGKAPKPTKVWEKQFDDFNAELAEMAQMDWDKIPEEYLWYYFHDLAYVELQPDLFRHVFPTCLKYWYETLMRNDSAERGDSDFHYAIMRGNFIQKLLTNFEKTKLYNYFCDGLIDRIEAQTSFKHDPSMGKGAWRGQNSWIYRFNTLGIVAPVTQQIWENWWKLDHPGKAFCAVMYFSGLMYLNGENPIYDAWTRDKGGGGPYLTEIDASIFDWAWREDNHRYLRNTLSVEYVLQKLEQAADMFHNPEDLKIVTQIISDAKARTDIIEIRIGDLIENLAKLQLAKDRWE
jgi:hypothetical protein